MANVEPALITSAQHAAEDTVRRFLAAVDAGDEVTLAELFTPDASAYLPFADTPGLIDGHAAIMSRFGRLIAAWKRRGLSPPFVGFEPSGLQPTLLAVEWTLVTFLVGIEGDTGRRTMLLRSTADGWRIFHLHASNLGRRDAERGIRTPSGRE